jgi:hypothetical protein
MNLRPEPDWEEVLRTAARAFPYPPTPDIAGAVRSRLAETRSARSRRWRRGRLQPAWALLVLALILAALLSVPPVRAALVDWLQIGAVRIWLVEPTPLPSPATTPAPTPIPLTSVLQLAGETTLDAARQQAPFPVRLPAYPPDLGAPDRVYVQNLDGLAVILVWLDPAAQVQMSLHMLSSEVIANKMQPEIVGGAYVHERPALWTQGPYLTATSSDPWALLRLVQGHVLIWTEGDLTYRLETDLPLAEAVRVAESLR